jgi:hypothetical protein
VLLFNFVAYFFLFAFKVHGQALGLVSSFDVHFVVDGNVCVEILKKIHVGYLFAVQLLGCACGREGECVEFGDSFAKATQIHQTKSTSLNAKRRVLSGTINKYMEVWVNSGYLLHALLNSQMLSLLKLPSKTPTLTPSQSPVSHNHNELTSKAL